MKSHEHNSNHESDNFATLVREAVAGEALPASDPSLREALLKRLDQPAVEPALKTSMADRRRTFFQRAGIALASTAALALVGVIWQRPALERAIGMNTPSAVQREEIRDNEIQPLVLTSKTRPGQGLGHGRGSGERPENEVEQGTYLSRVNGNSAEQRWGDGVAGQDPASFSQEGRLEGNPTQDYRSRVWPSLKKRYGEGGPPMSSGPFGNQQGSGGAASEPAGPASTVTGTPLPASQPAGLTPGLPPLESTSRPGDVAGRPSSGKPASFSGRGEGLLNQLYVIPGPDSNQPARPLPAKPGEPGQASSERFDRPTDEKLAREVDRLDTYNKSIPANGPVSGSGQANEGRVDTEKVSGTTVQLPPIAAVTTKDSTLTKEREDNAKKLATVTSQLNTLQSTANELRQKTAETELARTKAIKDGEAKQGEDRFSFYFGLSRDGGAPGEQYAKIIENEFLNPRNVDQALSTFSIDVDTASYANVRRFLTNGQLPPPDAVRLEELVNYFKYQYPQPKGNDPFSVSTEMADCPWQPGHKLLRVGVQGKEIHRQERPASNIVFLIDTSGSMTDQNKLPLLKQAFTMLVGELGENDKVTMVTYAGNAGLKLPPTRGHEKDTIIAAIDSLQSGGSTHGSAGISLAYEVAAAQFIKGGTNKVILATDGDLNVGITDDAALVDLITKKAKTGVYLTVLGVGTGNLKDAKMERLANNGNGIYAYLDTVKEARKVLVEEMSGSLVTIAQDVKIQVEFNPAQVQSYRLLGYENRVMANQDFRNDAKDAGEIGAGHSVTAMYEVALVGAPEVKAASGQPLKYQKVAEGPKLDLTDEAKSGELLTVRLRYKQPEAKEEDAARELEFPLKDKGGSFNSASKEFQFASAVVAFGLSLRQSEYRGSANFSAVAEIAAAGLGEDVGGHRAEFLDLVRRAKTLRGE